MSGDIIFEHKKFLEVAISLANYLVCTSFLTTSTQLYHHTFTTYLSHFQFTEAQQATSNAYSLSEIQYQQLRLKVGLCTVIHLASFPDSCVGGKNLFHYTNLREARRLLPHKRCLPLTTLSADNDEGATKVLSSSPARVVHALVHSS